MEEIGSPVPLAAEHDLADFDSGSAVLDDWLRRRARKNESRFSRTYVACAETRVAGFYCLSAGAVDRALVPRGMARNAPELVPVAIIGRLAVGRSYAGHGIGSALLADALARIAGAAGTIGIAAVLIHAKDEAAKSFYLRCADFWEYPADSRTLFLPIDTVIATLT